MDNSVVDKNRDNEVALTSEEKVISLYKFIRDLSGLKQKVVMNIADYSWSCSFRNIPNDPQNIEIFYRDRVEEENTDSNTALLRVHKPEFHKCPEPDTILAEWLYEGWASFRNEVQVHEAIERDAVDEKQSIIARVLHGSDEPESLADASPEEEKIESENRTVIVEHFTDDEVRVNVYEKWLGVRNKWVEKQIIIDQTRKLFTRLYQLHVDLERDSETLEMVVTNGFLRDRDNRDINHPVITRRVKTSFNPIENTMSIEDTDVKTELYTMLFQVMSDINLDSITSLRDDLYKNDYHPLDRNDTPEFLKVLIHQLSPESVVIEDREPDAWYQGNRLLISLNPTFVVRKRVDGTLKAVEQIIENIEKTGDVPPHLKDIVSGGKIEIPEDDHVETIEEKLAAVGGESVDILLSKEANKEQLEIAQRIEVYNAVLVQGPPGTGKTHTIANLMGHFLAHGKSVLVTSHTKKALTVLKEKVAPGLQNLCVSVINDSNEDMEKSIDGITDYMSKYTARELKRQMDSVVLERTQIIKDLADTRKKLFAIINQECNSIVLNGDEISPSKAAAFILGHAEDLSYIPGNVRLYATLPVSFAELTDLYRSNEGISAQDEHELECGLPCPELLLSSLKFEKTWKGLQNAKQHLAMLVDANGWYIQYNSANGNIAFDTNFGKFIVASPVNTDLDSLSLYIESFGNIETWMKYAAVDGKKGGSFKQRWITLIEQIRETCDYAESVVSKRFGKDIKFETNENPIELVPIFEKLRDHYARKGKITKLDLIINSSFEKALSAVTINGLQIQSLNDCEIVLHIIELEKIRKQCAIYWNDLLSAHSVPSFFDLDADEPERVAEKWIELIQRYLDWYQLEYSLLTERLSVAHIPADVVFPANALDSDLSATDRILSAINDAISPVIDACKTVLQIQAFEETIEETRTILQEGKRINSKVCVNIIHAIAGGDYPIYAEAFGQLEALYKKYDLQQKRENLIKKIAPVAPQWAEAIKTRDGIHGENIVPSTIEDAWRWKQYSGIIAEITASPFDELQAKSNSLSQKYREITARYAEKSAWYHLLSRTERDIDMKQALHGWKLTVKKIGKGTGKNAPMYKAKARELMAKCQTAVPGWIMPINRALESLDPGSNRFDVIIIDEASQADVCALAIAYMAKKLIVVGDDKQVSPMAIGVETDKINALIQMHISGVIPNAHLYRPNTSLYDVAAMTFQPLMLCEHFRCVPEIIGFSNSLSYDFKIKPLRDASNCPLVPNVVNYRVDGGKRENHKKENPTEAKAIVALLIACMEQPEYKGKTFGIISLLGDEQVNRIQSLIFEHIDAKVIDKRRILCGNASNFQGDERDVVFLSVVDSNPGSGTLTMQGFGTDDAYRKRYNVAASRARDQLWVVHSLDAANDLKLGDIRKRLIDYSLNPSAFDNISKEIEEKSESPFEAAVAKTLVSRGYHLVQQWKVGAYRLDIVAVYGKKSVAIECDGEKYHNGEVKIREDMERQTILERIGWRFIRIRGSEYFRNPEQTMERVITELGNFGIGPEDHRTTVTETRTSELLQRTKSRAGEILRNFDSSDFGAVDIGTIEFALNAKDTANNVAGLEQNQSVMTTQDLSTPTSLKLDSDKPKGTKTPADSVVMPHIVVASEPKGQLVKNHPEPKQEKKASEATAYTSGHSNSTKSNVAKNVSKPQEENAEQKPQLPCVNAAKKHEQLTIDGVPAIEQTSDDVISLIKAAGIEYFDKRPSKGALWIVGGREELSALVSKCRKLGVYFTFKQGGGKTTRGRDGWWTK